MTGFLGLETVVCSDAKGSLVGLRAEEQGEAGSEEVQSHSGSVFSKAAYNAGRLGGDCTPCSVSELESAMIQN